MPMRSEMIHQVYIADGFDDDCDLLVQRCLQTERLNYETFCEIWKDMQFDSLYVGRTSTVEIAEFSEEMIHIAKQYMMTQTTNFEETVAGLFLLYGLLNLQPYPGFAMLRLIPKDVTHIKKIEEIARRERRHDVLYILGTVLIKHTQYHAEQRERGIEQVYRKYLEDFISIDRSGYRPRGVFYRQTEELDVIRELAAITDRYENAKKAVTGSKMDPSLSYINKSLPSELDASLKKVMIGITATADDDEIDAADVHYSKVQAIKEKAMKNAVGGIRHLTTAAERPQTTETSQQVVSEIKSKPGKVKSSSPTKTQTLRTNIFGKSPRTNTLSPKSKSKSTSSPKPRARTSKPIKRKLTPKKGKSKKSKCDISSDSDSDIALSELDKDSNSDYNVSDDEIDVNTFAKSEKMPKDVVEVEIDDIVPHIGKDDVEVFDPEILDKLNKLKAKIAFLEDEVSNSSSCSKKTDKANSDEVNCDDKESGNQINKDEEYSGESEDTDNANDDKTFKKPKQVKSINFYRRLCKLGVLPEEGDQGKGLVTRDTRKSDTGNSLGVIE